MTRALVDRATHAAALSSMLGDRAAIVAATSDIDPPIQLAQWLGQLGKLYGVPYRYLIPHDLLLPDESIRFFQLDESWIYALIEGACSIGHASTTQATQHAATSHKLHAVAQAPKLADGAAVPITGFVLRSQVVPGWPKLEIVPFDENGTELTLIRRDLLSPSILLYLVRGTIDHVVLREPAIGLHSGIDIDGEKRLRYVTVPTSAPAGTRAGDQLANVAAAPGFRDGGNRVLAVDALASAIETLLLANTANTAPDGQPLPFTAAEFGLEMVEGTQAVTFQSGTGS